MAAFKLLFIVFIKDHVKSVLRIRSAQVYIPMVGTRQHRGKTSAHASTLLKSVLRTCSQVFRMLSKTQNGSDFDVLPFL